jgi:PhnB protein
MDMPRLPDAWKENVMHATFECEGASLRASGSVQEQPKPAYAGFAMSLHVRG